MLELDVRAGVLVIEAIEPGTPLAEADDYPRMEDLADLMVALQLAPAASHPPVAHRITHLFDSGLADYGRRPELEDVVPRDLYERGRRLAMRLAGDAAATVLLHGDLTPVNVLDGGADRGLVAIDPAPCLGDPAFDAVDLLFWRAHDLGTVTTRARRLTRATGADADRMVRWCAAFAAMIALEEAEAGGDGERVAFLVDLAHAET